MSSALGIPSLLSLCVPGLPPVSSRKGSAKGALTRLYTSKGVAPPYGRDASRDLCADKAPPPRGRVCVCAGVLSASAPEFASIAFQVRVGFRTRRAVQAPHSPTRCVPLSTLVYRWWVIDLFAAVP
jgi:hypothetical protein